MLIQECSLDVLGESELREQAKKAAIEAADKLNFDCLEDRDAFIEEFVKGYIEGRAEERVKVEAEKAQFIANLRAMGIPEEQIKQALGEPIPAPEEHSAAEDDESDGEDFEP